MHATNAAMGQPQNWSFRALAARSGPSELEKDAARLVRQRKISKQVEKQVAPLAYNAVVQGDLRAFQNIQAQSITHLVINHRYKDGLTLLQLAAALGQTEVCRHLLVHGADLGARTANGATAAILAASAGHTATLALMLEAPHVSNAVRVREVLVTQCTSAGETALMAACKRGHTPTVQLLVQSGADVHAAAAGCERMSVLMYACNAGQVEIAQHLLGLPGVEFQVQSLDAQGRSILTHAAISGSQATLSAIFDHFAVAVSSVLDLPDKAGHTPLHHACSGGYAPSLQMLHAHGAMLADPVMGPGLLALACGSGNSAMVAYVFKQCPELCKQSPPEDSTDAGCPTACGRYPMPIEDAPIVHALKSGSHRIVSLLLEQGAHIDQQDMTGMTVLMWAASLGKTQLCQHLVDKYHADPRITDDQTTVARVMAQRCGHLATADALSKLAVKLLKSEPQLVLSAQAPLSALATSLSRHLQLVALGSGSKGQLDGRHGATDWQLISADEGSMTLMPDFVTGHVKPDALLYSESGRVAILIVVASRWGPEVLPADVERIARHQCLADALIRSGWKATLHVTDVGPHLSSLSKSLKFFVETLGYEHHAAEALTHQMHTALLWK